MRNLLVFFVCLAGIYSSYAQQRIDALEFVKNAPWDLTESEIDEKYKENSFELADSLKVSLAASSGGNLNFANKFLDEFCIGIVIFGWYEKNGLFLLEKIGASD